MIENILLNPNLAYLFLVAGFSLAVLAILSPGTGVLEIAAFFSLLLAGYGIYNLPINYWALAILLLGLLSFIWAVRRAGRLIYLVVSILALVIGSAYFFRGETIWRAAVNPVLAAVTSILAGGFFWIVASKTLEAGASPPSFDLNKLIGETGEAKTDILHEGSAQVLGELWAVRSTHFIPAGSIVRVVARDGFILDVVQDSEEI